ncbi:MAG: peptidase T [Elusimicrobia bacterium CG08_land_8_20_14_0_20_59_10]|nr:MAG: peptidase T [Elusimicrobia bacterium CG08_land_8_20_14_0_20_59_10]
MTPAINEKRMVQLFCDLARITSLSGKEGAIARRLSILLRFMGAEVHTDDAGRGINGETGNLIARFPGTGKGRPFLLSAHMDTVGPADNVKPQLHKDRITSDGATILGADCKAGIAVIVEVIKTLEENRIPHPPIEAVFTISEEMALMGAKFLDYTKIKARCGLIFDNEQPLENVITSAPAADKMDIKVYGAAAHAGVAPEKGISAIKIVSEAIAVMKLGRIDSETTANIGFISGGNAINIIPASVELSGEARSHDPAKLKKQTRHMEDCLKKAVKRTRLRADGRLVAPRYEFSVERKFPNLHIEKASPVLALIARTMRAQGLKMKPSASGGGTDANIMYGHGIKVPILSTGMREVHTTHEYLDLKDFFGCARLTLGILSGWTGDDGNDN